MIYNMDRNGMIIDENVDETLLAIIFPFQEIIDSMLREKKNLTRC